MSRAALAQRPPDAPLISNGRQLTAHLQASAFVRFEPDVIRARPPPPSGFDAPTLPLYLRPLPPPAVAPKPPAPVSAPAKEGKDPQGKDAQGKDAQGKDAQGKDAQGKDAKGKEAKDKKGQQAKDGKDKDGAGGASHKGKRASGPGGAGHGGQANDKKGGGKDGKSDGEDAGAADQELETPFAETGSVELDHASLTLSDPSHSFDGPTALTARPPKKAGAPKPDPDPDIATYPAVFAEAAAAARRLHDALIADAVSAADAARAAASSAADRRQSELDRSLQDLDDGLADARLQLDSLAGDAASLVDQRATLAEQAIRQAAAGAKGALAAAKAKMILGKSKSDKQRATATAQAATYQVELTAAGVEVAARLTAFKANPEAAFPYPGGPMPDAVNEAIVTRSPKRAEHRLKAYADELTAQSAAMGASFGRLPAAFDAAFQTVDGWIEKTSKQGPAAVDQAAASSLKQLATMRRQMLTAIRNGRARTDAALVRQHNAARAQTIAAHTTRAKSEATVESRRAEQDVTGLRALAIAQASATRVLSDGFAKETDREEKAFAKAVVTASRGFLGRVAAADSGQRPRLVASAANNRAVTERQSRSSGEGLVRSADAVASQLGVAAQDAGDGLFSQANDTSSGYAKLAEPVSKSIQAFLPPVGKAFDEMIKKLDDAVDKTAASVTSYYETGKSGESGAGKGDGSGAAPTGGGDAKQAGPPPKMIPKGYVDLTRKVAADPKTDTQIADLADKAPSEITSKIHEKSSAVWTHIGAFHVETDAVLGALRSITARQGAAIKWDFADQHGGRDIVAFITINMPKTFSSPTTNKRNVDAAINYLNGNNVEGALNELKAAVNWSNENARVEAVARSLTPAQWAELKRLHPDELKDVREDLDGVNQDIFKALESEGETAAAKNARLGELGISEESGQGVAKANALRLRDQIDHDREKRGDAGADKAADDVENMAKNAGSDVISGADPVAALEEHPIDAIDVADPARERNKKQWEDTKQSFDKIELARKGGPEAAPPGAKSGWSIAAYASQQRDYDVYVYDKESDPYGEYGHYETKTEGISGNQTRLIQNIVDYGPDSDEAAAARVMVELNRDGGKPKQERLDKAMHSTDLDAREGEDKSKLDPKEKQRRLDSARERQQRVLGLVGQYQNPGVSGPWDPEAVRKQVAEKLTTAEAGDPSGKALVERTMRGPAAKWDDEQTERRQDAKTAFDYALAHEGERGDTLKRTFGRMDHGEIEDSVKEWNAAHPNEKPLYQQLNLFSQGSWWTEKLSGDERNDVELAAMGVARNTRERAEIGRFRAEQQIRDAGFLGKLAGKVTGDWDRLVESRDKVEQLMGLPHGSFDEFGRAKGAGNFDEDGKFKPPAGGSAAELEVAMNMTHLTAESYKVMTDSLATAVTTALVVVAAVVTTALTGGAAASIWIPVLVTAAAGLTGMALSAAIKGNRYSRAEMERDLVMTFVQAATAGLGAAAGVAIKGGMPALRAVVTEAAVSEKVLEGVAEAAGRQAMSKGWTLVAEMGVGAGTNAINSAAGAAMDPTNRARGESGDKAFDAGIKGLFSGALGSFLAKPAGALGGRVAGGYGQRVVGNVVSGVGQRAAEIGYDQYTGERRMEGFEIVDELKGAAGQAVVQSSLEHGAAEYGDARRARTGAARGGGGHGEAERSGPHAPGEAERRAPTPEEQRAARRGAPEAESGGARPAREGPVEPGARAAPAPEPIVLPLPSDMGPVVAAAEKLRPPELPPIAASPTETPPRPAEPPPTAEAREPLPASRGPPDADGPARLRKPPVAGARPADEDGPATVRKQQAEEKASAGPSGTKKPPPLPLAAIKEAPADFLEGAVMIDPNSTSRAEVEATYHKTIAADPSREVAIYRNPITGEHIMVFGNQDTIFIGLRAELGESPHAAEPAALRQDWKEILPADIGRWELEAHYHPGAPGQHEDAPMWRRLPSGGEGDFGVLRSEAQAAGGPRESVIHFRDNGRTVETVFGHDPSSKTAKYWIEVENPATGKRERHEFPSVQKYEDWAAKQSAQPRLDLAKGAGGGPLPASAAPRPDESLTIRHGTSEKGAENLAATGINPHRSSGESDDFSRGFYTTLDEPNAREYAVRGARQQNRRTPGAGDRGAVIELDIKLSELGHVVDVRPGAEHHDAWQEFLDRRPPAYPPGPTFGYYESAREWGVGKPGFMQDPNQRGAVFEAFLREKGLTDADAIRGGLGTDPWTHGISAQEGEQIVIRSKRLANVLNERLGYPLIPEDGPALPRSRSAGAPDGQAGPSAAREPLKALPAPAVKPETAARKAASMEVDQRAIDAFRAMRPEEGAKLDALLALAPDVVMAAIRGDEMTPSQRAAAEADAADRHARSERGEPQPAGARLQPTSAYREEALRETLTEKGLPPEEIERHVGELRELLKTPDQRVADYRDAILSGQLTPKEIADWHAFAARKTPDQPQVPLEHLQAELVSQFAQKLAASGGGVREFIGAVRELEAWKAKVAGLDAEAAAALPRQIRAEELDKYRGLKPTKKANPQRDALRELDKTEATKRLATEILSKFTGDPNQHAALLAEWETARREAGVDPAVIAAELGHLNTVLTHPELSTRLQKAVAAYTAQDVKSVSLEAMALADPVLLALAATNRAQFIERFGAMMQREAGARAEFIKKLGAGKFAAEYDKRTLNAGDFRAEVDTDMAARIKSVASEAAATFNVAEAMGLAIIKSDSTSRGQTNQAGIDIVAVEPTPEMGPRPEKVPVHLFDDKAVAAPLLGDVTALTKNLAKNLETAAGGPLESLLAAEKAGLPIDLDHKAALTQMMDAAKEIAGIDESKLPKTGSKDSGAYPYQQVEYADAVAAILKKHGITLHITSEYGQVMDLAPWIKRYGFLLWDKQFNVPDASVAAAPPAPPGP